MATTTSTSTPPAATFPLTGLTTSDIGRTQRPALSVKVDNASPARPQAGLNTADIVAEELVEGGLTRFFVTYQSQDAPVVGPVRSARPVDADLLRELGGGLFAYSGAAAGEIAPVKAHSTAVLLSDDAGNPGFHRASGRLAPYNLYASTVAMYHFAGSQALHAPPQLFTYSATPPPAAAATTSVSLAFSQFSTARWTWTPATSGYVRTQDGVPDLLDDLSQVQTTDIVVLSVAIRGTGIFDAARREDPLVVVVGSGPCWVFRDGIVEQGTWQRPSYDVPVRLFGPGNQPLTLRPGRTWMELLPQGSTPRVS